VLAFRVSVHRFRLAFPSKSSAPLIVFSNDPAVHISGALVFGTKHLTVASEQGDIQENFISVIHIGIMNFIQLHVGCTPPSPEQR
jgi:predicted membrane-bound dolichyl-phosphate-mannose-protein mannosyltransferase